MPWLTAQEARTEPYWPGQSGDPYDDTALDRLLASAREQCQSYAPTLPDAEPVPEAWRQAQSLQARAIYRAGLAAGREQIGVDGLVIPIYPMDMHVKALLRPPTGRPVIA